jgi:hypothetical protein
VKIKILDEAQQDLIEGFRFYESREAGVGSYFLDCHFSDIARGKLTVCFAPIAA